MTESNLLAIPFWNNRCNVNTVPDRVLEKARKNKLGYLVKGASVEDPDLEQESQKKTQSEVTKYVQANRDYK